MDVFLTFMGLLFGFKKAVTFIFFSIILVIIFSVLLEGFGFGFVIFLGNFNSFSFFESLVSGSITSLNICFS